MNGDHLDLTAALKALAAAGLTRILCEGGGGLAAELIRASLVDELAVFTAGALIGADGVHSLTRTNLLGGPSATYGGRTAWRTLSALP